MDFWDKLTYTYSDPWLFTGIILAMLLIVGYYGFFIQKNKYKGKPSEVPREEPPKRLPPAALRYIWKPGFDSDCLVAGIMNAVVKDCYRVKWRENSFSVYINKRAALGKLSGGERAALSFNSKHYMERLGISKLQNRITRSAEERMNLYMDKVYGKYLVKVNILTLIGIAVSLIACFGVHFFWGSPRALPYFAIFIFLVFPLLLGISYGIYYAIKTRNWVALPIGAILLIAISTGAYHLEDAFPYFILPSLIPLILVNGLCHQLLPKLKPDGGRLRVEIEEFRQFLMNRIESDREFSKEEYYLIPYMVALEIPFKNKSFFDALLTGEKGTRSLPFSPY